MNSSEELAARLRQSIQGCSLHNHGPVQAWAAIDEACTVGDVKLEEIAALAIEACAQRISALEAEGVREQDPRIQKERLTQSFIERLLGRGPWNENSF